MTHFCRIILIIYYYLTFITESASTQQTAVSDLMKKIEDLKKEIEIKDKEIDKLKKIAENVTKLEQDKSKLLKDVSINNNLIIVFQENVAYVRTDIPVVNLILNISLS